MRIFLSEYLTSGAFDGEAQTKAALATEGAAMLRALAADAAVVPGWSVAVTWDASLPAFGVSGVEVWEAASPIEERRLFERLAAEADATLVIAPEFDGILEQRCRLVAACGGRFVGPTPEAIGLCADKLALAGHLRARGIATIPTEVCDFAALPPPPESGWVIKPRDGAGSMNTFLIGSGADLAAARHAIEAAEARANAVVQPFIEGEALSIAAIVGSRGFELLPVCRQHIERGRQLHYAGGSVPAATGRDEEIEELARRTLAAVPGLFGYVGIDVLLPAQGEPVVVEINPRLTSSYHGYRALAKCNLAERVLAPDEIRPPVEWPGGRVEFLPDGTARHTDG